MAQVTASWIDSELGWLDCEESRAWQLLRPWGVSLWTSLLSLEESLNILTLRLKNSAL